MPAKSVAQRKFMGMVRATQKGEMDNPSPELKRAANDMGAKAVNKFAKTKEKNLPQKIGEEKTKNCGCGKDPCITYGPKKNAHKMPDGTVMPGKEHKESYGVGGSLMFSGTPGGTSHSNTRVGSINKKDKKKKEVKEQIRAVVEAKYEAGASTYGKATIRNKRKFGKAGDMPDVMTGKKVNPTDETRGELILKRRADHKAKRGVKSEAVYTGPDKEDRKQIKKMDNPSYAKKLADYEKNMDPKKRQALKDKATKGMKFVHEDAPTMSTGSGADGAGFSQDADENGPTAGMDQPLGGTMKKMKGKGGLTKKKAKCKKSPDDINKVCESTEARYLSFLVQMEDVEFIFQGKSPADVKIRLRKIYRPEKLKGVKITRMLPAQVLHYYWEKRQASM